MHLLERERERERDGETESKKSLPTEDGHAAIPSPSFFSRNLGHARTYTRCEFKPPGPGLEPRSTSWESGNIAIMLTACPQKLL